MYSGSSAVCFPIVRNHLTMLKIGLAGPAWIVDLTYSSPFGENGSRSVFKQTIVYRRMVREPQSYSTFGHLCTCWLEWEHKAVRIVTVNMRKSLVVRPWIAPVPLVVTVNCLSAWLLMFMRRVMFLKRKIWAMLRPSTDCSGDVVHPPQISGVATLKGSVNIHINSVNIDINPMEIRSGKFYIPIPSYDFRLRAFRLIHS